MEKCLPARPTRSCRKKIGPGEASRVTIVSKIISGNQIGNASRMHVMSKANFQSRLICSRPWYASALPTMQPAPAHRRCQKFPCRSLFRVLSYQTVIRRSDCVLSSIKPEIRFCIFMNQIRFPRTFRFYPRSCSFGWKRVHNTLQSRS